MSTDKPDEDIKLALVVVLRELVEKVQELTPAIENAFSFAQVHGQRYSGPNWSKEMRSAKNLLDELERKGGE